MKFKFLMLLVICLLDSSQQTASCASYFHSPPVEKVLVIEKPVVSNITLPQEVVAPAAHVLSSTGDEIVCKNRFSDLQRWLHTSDYVHRYNYETELIIPTTETQNYRRQKAIISDSQTQKRIRSPDLI